MASITVTEFDFNRSKAHQCCGMEFHHFQTTGKYIDGKYQLEDIPFTYEFLVDQLRVPDNKQSAAQGMKWYIKPCVILSGTERQFKEKGGNPHRFIDWIKSEGEEVTESPWIYNYSQKIKVYIWAVSEKFVNKLNDAYNKKYGGDHKVGRPITVAVTNHDWLVGNGGK